LILLWEVVQQELQQSIGIETLLVVKRIQNILT